MKVVFALAVLFVAQICAIPTSFVENGNVAVGQKHAVIVLALQRIGGHRALFGGGNIITERHILTTAHLCVRAKEFLIAYGEVAARETIRLRARSALIHSHFNPDTLENDLAVITLSNGQTINRRHGTPIPVSCRGLFPGDEGSVASFGFNNDNSNTISDKLLVARQVIIANEPCARTFNRQLHRNQFCAQDQQPIILPPPVSEESSSSESDEEDDPPQEDPSANAMFPPLFGRRSIARNNNNGQRLTAVCRGDTGSGLVRSINNVNTLYALVSRVPEGCNNDNPAIYTNVAPFCTWLEDCTLGAVSTTNN